MLFTSLEFLLLFLPLTLAVYYCLPGRLRNACLLFASLLFYAWGEPKFVLVMIGSIAFNYLMALLVSSLGFRPRLARGALWIAISGNLGLLLVYKYANFLTATAREIFPSCMGVVPQTSILLPIGISFFTFQAMSYVIDVSRGTRPQRNFLDLALYIALFPQLIAGPIVRYSTVREQIGHREHTMARFSSGVYRFLVGFNKKMLLANFFAITADRAFASPEPSMLMAWCGAICYTLQIFFDFSGYSDMAIGLGRMFGFEFLENFNYPYVSQTISEFWRRWHISLGSWFRDYVYFPLGGSRVARARLVGNLSVVWLLTGIWHGANWTFLVWGALHGGCIVVEKLAGIPDRVRRRMVWRIPYQAAVLLLVVLGWVLFRSESLAAAGAYFEAMACGAKASARDVFDVMEIAVLLPVGLMCATPVFRVAADRMRSAFGTCAVASAAWAWQFALFVISVSCLVVNAHNPFIYFNF